MGTSTRRLRDPFTGCPGDQMTGHSGDVPGALFLHDFLIQLRHILNLLRQVTGNFIVNCSSEKFGEQYSNLNYKN